MAMPMSSRWLRVVVFFAFVIVFFVPRKKAESDETEEDRRLRNQVAERAFGAEFHE